MVSSARYAYALVFVIGVFVGLGVGAAYQRFHVDQGGREVVVLAGAAAAPVYREVSRLFEHKRGVRVVLNIGGSGALLSAIEVARTSDVYIPGSQDYLLKAKERGVVDFSKYPPRVLAYMVPAIIVPKGNPRNVTSLEDLGKPGVRVGIGDPELVCVGAYAKEILERSGLWEDVSKNIVVYAASCEEVARLVYMGAVDAVIGWHTFYYWNPERSDIVWIDPQRVHKVGYIAGAVTRYAKNPDLATEFLEFLSSEEAQRVWRKYGYYVTLEEVRQHAPFAEVERLE